MIYFRIFGGNLIRYRKCMICSSMSDPETPSNFLHYVYASEIISLHMNERNSVSLIDLIRKCNSMCTEVCPSTVSHHSTCDGPSEYFIFCYEPPPCMAFAVGWQSDAEPVSTLEAFLILIPNIFLLKELFNVEPPDENICYTFCGFVCYYGMHYVAICES